MKFEKLQPGVTVYDVHSYRMGNTTLRSVGVWPVRILSADAESQTVMASWNGNPARKCYAHQWSKWRLSEPELIRGPMGNSRLAKRGELLNRPADGGE